MINTKIMLSMVTHKIVYYECLLDEHWLLKDFNDALVNFSRIFMNQAKKEAATFKT